ncbi:unnamed protein product [Sphagnum jensenii]|uniref:NADH:ubiquinone oxidoreductase intermediate-associated protein 30 domain-containing protein n=1 Tax=Sphagnum jensenii TaxID=128206 RepID=A0ABP0WI61_9BRYO
MLRALLQSSIAATRRAVAWNLKDLTPATECDFFKFATAADLIQWEAYSDAENGGMPQCELNNMNSVRCVCKMPGVFAGNLSVELMEHANTRMRRSGFSGIRTVQDLNLEDFNTIAMRVKGDGWCYVSTIRTENWMGAPGATDPNTWQAFVFAPRDEWSVIKIPLARYLPTWKGKIVESDAEMNAARVTGMGLSLTAEGGPEGGEQGPGPFRLELDWIKALRVT